MLNKEAYVAPFYSVSSAFCNRKRKYILTIEWVVDTKVTCVFVGDLQQLKVALESM